MDKVIFSAGCMSLFQAINRATDVSEEIISIKRLPIPGNYSDSFDILKNAKVINKGLRTDLKKILNKIYAIDEF